MHIICTANTSAAILQHGIYCSSTAVWRRPTVDPLVFCFTLTIFVGYMIKSLNTASTCWRLLLSLVFLLQCYYLYALLRQCSICCSIFYNIWRYIMRADCIYCWDQAFSLYGSGCFREHF